MARGSICLNRAFLNSALYRLSCNFFVKWHEIGQSIKSTFKLRHLTVMMNSILYFDTKVEFPCRQRLVDRILHLIIICTISHCPKVDVDMVLNSIFVSKSRIEIDHKVVTDSIVSICVSRVPTYMTVFTLRGGDECIG